MESKTTTKQSKNKSDLHNPLGQLSGPNPAIASIRRVAVLGAGTMGGGIAAFLASAGLEVVLLDCVPTTLTKQECARKLTLKDSAVRNRLVQAGLDKQKNMKPPAFYDVGMADKIKIGNFEDDLALLTDVDWVIEAVVEDLQLKQGLYGKIIKQIGQHTIVSSNTSGLPISQLTAKCPASFKKRFLGMHFFNPPRYMPLLEMIPGADTDPQCVSLMTEFATHRLGKEVVLCKDTPNFIANRLGLAINGFRMSYAMDNGYSIEAIDSIAGPLMGYPRTAVFRLTDLVGLDITQAVSAHLAQAFPAEVASYQGSGKMAACLQDMLAKGWLGNKSGIGFYKRVEEKHQTAFHVLDYQAMTHRPPQKVTYASVGAVRKIADLGERLQQWIQHDDEAARYVWQTLAFTFSFVSQHVTEVADDLLSIDRALCAGYAMQMGPFATWDALGVAETVARMEASGFVVAPWVHDMLQAGCQHFFRIHHQKLSQYNIKKKAYVEVARRDNQVLLPVIKAGQTALLSNGDAALYDMGDGVVLFEFTSRGNVLTEDLIALLLEAITLLNDDVRFKAMVIGNEGRWFSAGANINPQSFLSSTQSPKEVVEQMIQQFQRAMMAIRFSQKPIVSAIFDRTLGGGAEVALASHRIVAHAELYMGLVEMGVGLIPGGGGCKELLRRVVNPVAHPESVAGVMDAISQVMQTIGMAKVSMGAWQAKKMGFLSASDRIVMNRSQLLYTAKQEALKLWDLGFIPLQDEPIYVAGSATYHALCLGLSHMHERGALSEYDLSLGKQLAWVLCGGDVTAPQWVSERVILKLERTVFCQLITQAKTIERILHTLKTGKPLRN